MLMKKWTVLVYMAGENEPIIDGERDLAEMAKVGSNDEINIVAQFDRAGPTGTQRFYLTKGGGYEKDCIAKLGKTNTGDPKILIDFLKWGITTYKAEHYMIILWNHGNGWKDEDVHNRIRMSGPERDITSFEMRKVHRGGRSGIGRALFSTTIEAIAKLGEKQRAICFDDGSKDFLDSLELKNAFNLALKETNVKKFDIIGFDACLMNMLEVSYQIKDSAKILIGSEESEPLEGLPYDLILEVLAENPDITPEKFANSVVDEYIRSYDNSAENVTQSAIDLEKIIDVKDKVDKLAYILGKEIKKREVFYSVLKSAGLAQHFYDGHAYDNLDLFDFARLIKEDSLSDQIKSSAQDLINSLNISSDGFIIAAKTLGKEVKNSHGVSIYFPITTEYPTFYDKLDISKEGKWNDFIKAFKETYDNTRNRGSVI